MRACTFEPPPWLLYLHVFAAVVALSACSTTKEVYRNEAFQADTPFSKRIQGSSKVVCWSVKRAFLTQGYMLDRSADSVTLTGTKDYQRDDETNVTLRLQTSCADNHDGTSTVFATASREVSQIQRVKQSVSAGVSIATITVPSGSEKVLRILSRETVRDADFYQRFYNLVTRFSKEDEKSAQ